MNKEVEFAYNKSVITVYSLASYDDIVVDGFVKIDSEFRDAIKATTEEYFKVQDKLKLLIVESKNNKAKGSDQVLKQIKAMIDEWEWLNE